MYNIKMDFDLLVDYFLLDSSTLRWSTLFSSDRQYDVHPLNKGKEQKSEFENLYPDLRKHPVKFFEYMRMSIETFDMILARIEHRIRKNITNYKRPITPSERLMITLR